MEKFVIIKKINKTDKDKNIDNKNITNPPNTTLDTSITDFIPHYNVYTDGACINNGKPYAKAGIGIFFGENDPRNVSKKIEGKQTNNTAEITAIIETYRIIENDILSGKKVAIFTDSEYVMKCLSTYGAKCYKKGWTEDIPNKELVRTAYEMYKNKPNIKINHIRAHTGKSDIHSIGNENADRLANESLGIGFNGCPYATKQHMRGPSKIYLKVPFSRKEEVKGLGAKWDAGKKKWYILDDNENKGELVEQFSQ
jgi:ribonuclease HI